MNPDRTRFPGVAEPYLQLGRYLRYLLGMVGLVLQAGLVLALALVAGLLAWRRQPAGPVSWWNAFCVALICWLPAAVLLHAAALRVPNVVGWPSAAGPFSVARYYGALAAPAGLAVFCALARRLWWRLRPDDDDVSPPPLLPRAGLMTAVLALSAYALLLIPLARVSRAADAEIEHTFANEISVARKACEPLRSRRE